MIHPCPCCQLRFVTTGEREEHVRDDHASTERAPEQSLTIVRNPTHVGSHPYKGARVPLRT